MRNKSRIKACNQPIALIEAVHSDSFARSARPQDTYQLNQKLYLCVGSSFLLTSNHCLSLGLCNGATGTTREIVYIEGQMAPGLPSMVIIELDQPTEDQHFC